MSNRYRNLEINTPPLKHLPKDCTAWSDSELAAWKAHLQSCDLFTPKLESAWDRMVDYRTDALPADVAFTRRDVPVEVLAESPIEWLAYRSYPNCPDMAALSHQIAVLIETMQGVDGMASKASQGRLIDLCDRFNRRSPHIGSFQPSRLRLPGGFVLSVREKVVTLTLGADEFMRAPATDAQRPHLRKLVSRLQRLVRMAVAVSLRHAVPGFRLTLDTALEFALPVQTPASTYENAIVVSARGRSQLARRDFLPACGYDLEAEARYRVAGMLMRHKDSVEVDAALVHAVRAPFFRVRLLQRIDVQPPALSTVMSRMDETSRRLVVAFRDGVQVALDTPAADAFQVWQDSLTGPALFATVPTLAMAVDLEMSNRVNPGFRLQLVTTAGKQLGYQLAPS